MTTNHDLMRERYARAREDLYAFCEQKGWRVDEITSNSRRRAYFIKRIEVAGFLYMQGHSLSAIGRVMGQHITTIQYYLMSDEEREAKKAKMRKKTIDLSRKRCHPEENTEKTIDN